MLKSPTHIWAAFVFTITLLSAACGGPPVKRYYTLENLLGEVSEVPRSPVCNRTVTISSVDVASPYDLDKIVFRTTTLEIRYYNHRFWVSGPEEMFEKLISRRLEGEGLFVAVEDPIHASSDHLSLYIRLHRIEELDRGEDWMARLAMSFLLKDELAEKVIWKYGFDKTRKVEHHEMKAVVGTLNRIYNDEMTKIVESMRVSLGKRVLCQKQDLATIPN